MLAQNRMGRNRTRSDSVCQDDHSVIRNQVRPNGGSAIAAALLSRMMEECFPRSAVPTSSAARSPRPRPRPRWPPGCARAGSPPRSFRWPTAARARSTCCSPNGRRLTTRVTGPLGDPVDADWGLLADGTAVIEMARASGLALVERNDPLRADTRGVGELLLAAAAHGATRAIVTLGGSREHRRRARRGRGARLVAPARGRLRLRRRDPLRRRRTRFRSAERRHARAGRRRSRSGSQRARRSRRSAGRRRRGRARRRPRRARRARCAPASTSSPRRSGCASSSQPRTSSSPARASSTPPASTARSSAACCACTATGGRDRRIRRRRPGRAHPCVVTHGTGRLTGAGDAGRGRSGPLRPASELATMAAHRGDQEPAMASQVEVDPQETREWLEALDAVVNADGPQRAQFLLERVVGHAQLTGAAPAPAGTTPYLNTIPPQDEPPHPVDAELERRVRSIVRWNAIATILNANKTSSELGGHIASYQSAAVLYETGFNHFWRAPGDKPRRRPRLHAGPLEPRRVRPRVPRGPDPRGADAQVPDGGRRRRALAATRIRG